MQGINEINGKKINGLDHLIQSLSRLFSTPVGSYCMLREYGCWLFELLDQPGNQATLLQAYASITDAVLRWEPRIIPMRVYASGDAMKNGKFELNLEGIATQQIGETEPGQRILLTVPVGGA